MSVQLIGRKKMASRHSRSPQLSASRKSRISDMRQSFFSTRGLRRSPSWARQIVKFHVDMPGGTVYRLRNTDISLVKAMCGTHTTSLFGDIDVHNILKLSYCAMVYYNECNEVQSAIALYTYPNVPVVHPSIWPQWVANLYRLPGLNSRNTLWAHLLVYAYRDRRMVFMLFSSIFTQNPDLQQVIMVVPPECSRLLNWILRYGKKITPVHNWREYKTQQLMSIDRQHFVSDYKFRSAVDKDNDDIMPLLDAHNPIFRKLYGEFFIAELTTGIDPDRKVVVAEHEGRAVAVLILNSVVNLKQLNASFNLEPFYALRTRHSSDYVQAFQRTDNVRAGARIADHAAFAQVMEHWHGQRNHLNTRAFLMETSEFGKGYYKVEEDVLKPHSDGSNLSSFSYASGNGTKSTSTKSSLSLSINFSDLREGSAATEEDYRPTNIGQTSAFSIVASHDTNDDLSALLLSKSMQNLQQPQPQHSTYGFSTLRSARGSSPSASTGASAQSTNRNQYHGRCDAFVVEVAIAWPHHESCLSNLVACCFERFPDRHYCVMTVPSDTAHFPLLDTFVRVSPRPGNLYPHELYVAHKNTLLNPLTVRHAQPADVYEIEELIYTTPRAFEVVWMVRDCLLNHLNELFVMRSGDDLVAVAMLRVEYNYDHIKRNYELQKFTPIELHKSGCVGRIEYIILSPIYQRQSQYFLAEIHRLSGFTLLTYYVMQQDGDNYRHLVVNLAGLQPVKPRPLDHDCAQAAADADEGDEDAEDAEDTMRLRESALYISTMNLCSMTRVDVNARLAVVGTSTTAIAFLESLLFGVSDQYYATFNNIVVVSPYNELRPRKATQVRSQMFARRSVYNYEYLHQLSFKTFANFVRGVMTNINRKEKCITIDNQLRIDYDYLFLFCGQQFGRPTLHTVKAAKKTAHSSDLPYNVFVINTDDDATKSLRRLKDMYRRTDDGARVIVYGRSMEVYCCLSALLELGVRADQIIFAERSVADSEHDHQSAFPSEEIDLVVQKAIKAEGIQCYSHCRLSNWAWSAEAIRHHLISSVTFETKKNIVEVQCTVMFCYSPKSYSTRALAAIQRAGLVFDDGLVIDTDCSTHDPAIFAAGTCTKFSRRYYADYLNHRYYNSTEVGSALGVRLRKKLIPNYDEDAVMELTFSCAGEDRSSMTLRNDYIMPMFHYCLLPSKLHYLYVTKPGVTTPEEIAMTDNDYGTIMTTGDITRLDKQGYFKIHLNQHSGVETITCLSKTKFDFKKITQLYGKHEKLLNNLLLRFKEGYVHDFFEYFNQSWGRALFVGEYQILSDKLSSTLMNLENEEGLLSDQLLDLFKKNDFRNLPMEDRTHAVKLYKEVNYKHIIHKLVVQFIGDNLDLLDMYAHPSIVRTILQGHHESTLFKDM